MTDTTLIPDDCKKCKHCGLVKSIREFPVSRKSFKGCENQCKVCKSIRTGHKWHQEPKGDLIRLPDAIGIPMAKKMVAFVDPVDEDLFAERWSSFYARTDAHYAYRWKNYKRVWMHRVIVERVLGRELLPSEEIDHKDGDGLNNRRDNLRVATRTQNMQNKRINRSSVTKLKGVDYHAKSNAWRARITVNGKVIHLGFFATPDLAFAAYREAAETHFGEFARLK
jgi:hypothetical protein